ncbi:hypothetical protein COO60DRAFT_1506702 [Scenedesmus sp. NREL 46B-D3]|nr:hypothetical protein COO60DRAFT_1506702 [Scenedesmus sp. NREL 46B-D3]
MAAASWTQPIVEPCAPDRLSLSVALLLHLAWWTWWMSDGSGVVPQQSVIVATGQWPVAIVATCHGQWPVAMVYCRWQLVYTCSACMQCCVLSNATQ